MSTLEKLQVIKDFLSENKIEWAQEFLNAVPNMKNEDVEYFYSLIFVPSQAERMILISEDKNKRMQEALQFKQLVEKYQKSCAHFEELVDEARHNKDADALIGDIDDNNE